MIPVIFILIAGILFGYFLIGPANRSYTPLHYTGLVFMLAAMYGVFLTLGLSLATLFAEPDPEASILRTVRAYGFMTLYALAAAVGTYIRVRSK